MQKSVSIRVTILRCAVLTVIAMLLVVVFTRMALLNHTTVALAFLVCVLLAAYRWRLACSVYLSLLCTLLYNVFFLPPVGRLTIADPQNWIALAAFLATSVLVSQLSERNLREAEKSEARRREVELLYELSRTLLVKEDVQSIAREAPASLFNIFGFKAVGLYLAASNSTLYADPGGVLQVENELRRIALEQREGIEVRNDVQIIPLRMGMRHSLGVLAVAGSPFAQSYLETVASVVSVAVERASALDRSARAEAARESERLRTALVDSVTHELRTPLTAIRAASSALLEPSEISPSQRSELIEVIEEEGQRLDRLISQAIEMARLDSETLKPQLALQDARELVEIVLDRLKRRLREHPVILESCPGLPNARIDRALMERVLQHLLENAVAYSSPGAPITVRINRESDHLLFEVADCGQGIESEDLPFIFEKHFRGRRQNASSLGTGMGLAIAKAMMKVQGGEISVESTPGTGTTFRVRIPVA